MRFDLQLIVMIIAIYVMAGNSAISESSVRPQIDEHILMLANELIPDVVADNDAHVAQMGAFGLLASSLSSELLNDSEKLVLLQYASRKAERAQGCIAEWQKPQVSESLVGYFPNATPPQKVEILRLFGYLQDELSEAIIEDALFSDDGDIVAAALVATGANRSKRIREALHRACWKLNGSLQSMALYRLYDIDKHYGIDGLAEYASLVEAFPSLDEIHSAIVSRTQAALHSKQRAAATAAMLDAHIRNVERDQESEEWSGELGEQPPRIKKRNDAVD